MFKFSIIHATDIFPSSSNPGLTNPELAKAFENDYPQTHEDFLKILVLCFKTTP